MRRRWPSVTAVALLAALSPLGGIPAAHADPTPKPATADYYGYPDAEFAWPTAAVALDSPAHVTVQGSDITETAYVMLVAVADEYEQKGPVLATGTLTPGQPTIRVPLPTDTAGARWLYLVVSTSTDRQDWDARVAEDWHHLTVHGTPSTITATFPSGTVKTRTAVSVTGTVTGTPGRPVHVQAKGRNGTWVTLTEGTSRSDGTFTVAAPTWWAANQILRAYAPQTARDAAAATGNTGSLNVRRTYTPRGGTAYRYLPGYLARWDPCQVITYRINTDRMPKAYAADVRKGFAMVAEATGLRFQYVGTTKYVPYKKGQDYWSFPDNADFMVAFGNARLVPNLGGSTAGLGGASFTDDELLDGKVVFDTEARLGRSPAEVKSNRMALILHELAHAIGLDHVQDKRQLMYPTLTSQRPQFGAGDLRGLAAVGAAGGCIADSLRSYN